MIQKFINTVKRVLLEKLIFGFIHTITSMHTDERKMPSFFTKDNCKFSVTAFSLIEIMFVLVAISVIMAAFMPVISKQLNPAVRQPSALGLLKTDECMNAIGPNCILCNIRTRECLSCEIASCPSGKKLNYKDCKCE